MMQIWVSASALKTLCNSSSGRTLMISSIQFDSDLTRILAYDSDQALANLLKIYQPFISADFV